MDHPNEPKDERAVEPVSPPETADPGPASSVPPAQAREEKSEPSGDWKKGRRKRDEKHRDGEEEIIEDELGRHSSTRRELENKEKRTRTVLKIASVFIAVLMWFYVISVESPNDSTKDFHGIEILTDEMSGLFQQLGLTVLEGKGLTVDVVVSGRRADLAPLKAEDIVAYVDLGSIVTTGKFTRTIKYELPEGVSIKSASRSAVDLYVETISGRSVPVKAVVTADVEEGFQRGTPVVAPEYINVSGPQPLIEKIDHALVELHLGAFNSTVQRTAPVVLVDAEGNEIESKYIIMSAETVEVTVPAYVIKEVPLVPTLLGEPANPDNIVVTVDPPTVTISGTPEQVGGIDYLSLETIDVGEVDKERTFERNIIVPSGIRILENIKTANVTIQLKNMATRIFNVENIQLLNKPAKNVILRTKVLEVKVRGDAEALQGIGTDDIVVTVDLANMAEMSGVYEETAVVTISGHDELHVVGEYLVTLWVG